LVYIGDLAGSVSTVAKKASKDKIVAAYNECFEKKLFSSPEQREADRLAQELEVIFIAQVPALGF
jgi:hypothetical protein